MEKASRWGARPWRGPPEGGRCAAVGVVSPVVEMAAGGQQVMAGCAARWIAVARCRYVEKPVTEAAWANGIAGSPPVMASVGRDAVPATLWRRPWASLELCYRRRSGRPLLPPPEGRSVAVAVGEVLAAIGGRSRLSPSEQASPPREILRGGYRRVERLGWIGVYRQGLEPSTLGWIRPR